MNATHEVSINKDPPKPDMLVLTTTFRSAVTGQYKTPIAAYCDERREWIAYGSGMHFRLTVEEIAAAAASVGSPQPWRPPEALRVYAESQASDMASLADPSATTQELRAALRMKETAEPPPGA